ncbi:hypothetical protein ACFQS2_16270 [Brachybacterium sp. GCM10030267]|uniref:hypothetical protein n=1 Tax=Brachybacterium sp. GCM10030267 TaxID=3273381 RepID=UPI00360DAE29
MMRFGFAVDRIDERIPGVDLPLMSVSQTHGVIRRSELTDKPHRADSLDIYKVCRQDDIVFNKMSIRSGAMGVAREDGLVTYHYEVMRPREWVDSRFIAYLMKSNWFTGELIKRERGIGAGGQGNVRTTEVPFSVLKTIDSYIPEAAEQRAISDYLDQETAQIDALVAKQEEFIGLLRERRSAVRDSALTGGLNGIGASKRTGNVWLPILPSGWQAVATRRLLSFGPSNGVSPEAGRVGDMRSLSIGAVRDGRVNASEDVTKYVDRDSLRDVSQLLLHYGDVLIVRGNGNINLVGRAGLVGHEFAQEEYIYPDLLIRIRTTADMLPEFFVAAFDTPTSRAQIELLARTTVGTFKISAADVRSIVLPCPPIDEQHAIIAHISQQTSRIDTLIAKAEEHIALAKERRSALITAAVTGQLDIRTARKAG